MTVYKPGSRGRHHLFIQPGKTHDVADFKDTNGNPIMYTVEFIHGEAKVSKQMGNYLIGEGIAFKSPLILPEGMAA